MAFKMHDKINEINETIREYMKIPDRDPSKLYEDLGEILKKFCPEWGPKHIRDRLIELGFLSNEQDREAEAGPSTTAGAARSFEVKEERLSETDEDGPSEVQDSDAYEADSENSDEVPEDIFILPFPDSSVSRIPRAEGRISSIYYLLNPPDTIEPEIRLEPEIPQIEMNPFF